MQYKWTDLVYDRRFHDKIQAKKIKWVWHISCLYFCTQTAEMALRLTAVNRWCITGTPIQKGIDGRRLLSVTQFL